MPITLVSDDEPVLDSNPDGLFEPEVVGKVLVSSRSFCFVKIGGRFTILFRDPEATVSVDEEPVVRSSKKKRKKKKKVPFGSHPR